MFEDKFIDNLADRLAPRIADRVTEILQQKGLLNDEEWSREEVREFLNVDNSTITRYIKSNPPLLNPKGTPHKQKFKASEVRPLKRKLKPAA